MDIGTILIQQTLGQTRDGINHKLVYGIILIWQMPGQIPVGKKSMVNGITWIQLMLGC